MLVRSWDLFTDLPPPSSPNFQAATLGLVQAMDTLGLSAEASKLESSLGSYWEVTPDDRKAARQSQELHDLVSAAANRLGRSRTAPSAGRLSFLAGAYSLQGGSGPPGLNTASMISRTNGPGTVNFASEALPLDAQVPQWLDEAAKLMNNQGLDSGGLLSSVRNLMVLRPWSLHDSWLRKGDHLAARGHYSQARELLVRARNHARHCSDLEAEAKSLLSLSRCESLANNFDAAIQLLQVGALMGFLFWLSSLSCQPPMKSSLSL